MLWCKLKIHRRASIGTQMISITKRLWTEFGQSVAVLATIRLVFYLGSRELHKKSFNQKGLIKNNKQRCGNLSQYK